MKFPATIHHWGDVSLDITIIKFIQMQRVPKETAILEDKKWPYCKRYIKKYARKDEINKYIN